MASRPQWHPPPGGFLFLLPAAEPAFAASACHLTSLAIIHRRWHDLPFCAGSGIPGVLGTAQGTDSEGPLRGRGPCWEIMAGQRVSLAFFAPIFCPRIAGCCADISRSHFQKDTMVILGQGISSIFSFLGSQAGKNRVFFFTATSHWAFILFQEFLPQWPH